MWQLQTVTLLRFTLKIKTTRLTFVLCLVVLTMYFTTRQHEINYRLTKMKCSLIVFYVYSFAVLFYILVHVSERTVVYSLFPWLIVCLAPSGVVTFIQRRKPSLSVGARNFLGNEATHANICQTLKATLIVMPYLHFCVLQLDYTQKKLNQMAIS